MAAGGLSTDCEPTTAAHRKHPHLDKTSWFPPCSAGEQAAAKPLQPCPALRPHRRQPTRLPHPWDSLGKNTGMGCHFLLQCMRVKSESEVAQSCPTLSTPMDCSLPGSSTHGIFQAKVLEWGAIAFSLIEARPCLNELRLQADRRHRQSRQRREKSEH